MQPMVRGSGRTAKLFLEEGHSHSTRPANLPECGRRPFFSSDHLGKQAEPDRDDLSPHCQGGDSLFDESRLLPAQLGRSGGKGLEGSAKRGQDPGRMPRLKQIDRRAVLPLGKPYIELLQELGHGHPEVVTDNQQRLHPCAVALSEGFDQPCLLMNGVSMKPLLELVDDDQELAAGRQPVPPADLGQKPRQIEFRREARDLPANSGKDLGFGLVRRRLDDHGNDPLIQPG